MNDNLEKKFYTELVSESYKTNDVDKISKKIKDTLNIEVSPNEVYRILNEDYELEQRKMEYSLNMSYIFY
jgi:hypothetical protein